MIIVPKAKTLVRNTIPLWWYSQVRDGLASPVQLKILIAGAKMGEKKLLVDSLVENACNCTEYVLENNVERFYINHFTVPLRDSKSSHSLSANFIR
jgi:hypothetical protein